jgi:hypothetical protein
MNGAQAGNSGEWIRRVAAFGGRARRIHPCQGRAFSTFGRHRAGTSSAGTGPGLIIASLLVQRGGDQGLLIVPPFVIVRAEVSWQLAGMSLCALLVLS